MHTQSGSEIILEQLLLYTSQRRLGCYVPQSEGKRAHSRGNPSHVLVILSGRVQKNRARWSYCDYKDEVSTKLLSRVKVITYFLPISILCSAIAGLYQFVLCSAAHHWLSSRGIGWATICSIRAWLMLWWDISYREWQLKWKNAVSDDALLFSNDTEEIVNRVI